MKYYSMFIFLILITALMPGCSQKSDTVAEQAEIVFDSGAYPSLCLYDGTYYYTQQTEMPCRILLYSARNPADLGKAEPKVIWRPTEAAGLHNVWSPEICRIDGKWYIYFEADNGNNTDNHQIYALENPSSDPMQGAWTLRGPVITNSEWNFGIHPCPLVVGNRLYLFWSGWQRRRTETETQCIFIAEMENPWTLKSDRVLLSTPEYEWERQWINPDGSRSAYPIFVNENPQAFLSPDGRNVILAYSASGIWTTYNSLGMLYASASADLLNPRSWTKVREPQFRASDDSDIFGTSNISVINVPDGKESLMMYQAKRMNEGYQMSHIRMKRITWDDHSLPVFGEP